MSESSEIAGAVIEAVNQQNKPDTLSMVFGLVLFIILGVVSWIGNTTNENQVAISSIQESIANIKDGTRDRFTGAQGKILHQRVNTLSSDVKIHDNLISQGLIRLELHQHNKTTARNTK